MSNDDFNLILYRLDKIEETLSQIHAEVKRTNGRVNELEKVNAEYDGRQAARRKNEMIAATVISGLLVASAVWFVQAAI
jgi:tetrahydromethanopterin S-methyltransferase subunit G